MLRHLDDVIVSDAQVICRERPQMVLLGTVRICSIAVRTDLDGSKNDLEDDKLFVNLTLATLYNLQGDKIIPYTKLRARVI